MVPEDQDELDDLPSDELEAKEETVADQASAATTISELEAEIAILRKLEAMANQVRHSGQDRKWDELSTILQDNDLMRSTDGIPEKLIKAGRIGTQLMAVVAEGKHGRIYLSPDAEQIRAAEVSKPEDYPDGAMPTNPRWFSPPAFGMTEYSQLFTNRQLTALTTFSALVGEAQKKAEADAVAAGIFNDHIPLAEGGTGARLWRGCGGVFGVCCG